MVTRNIMKSDEKLHDENPRYVTTVTFLLHHRPLEVTARDSTKDRKLLANKL